MFSLLVGAGSGGRDWLGEDYSATAVPSRGEHQRNMACCLNRVVNFLAASRPTIIRGSKSTSRPPTDANNDYDDEDRLISGYRLTQTALLGDPCCIVIARLPRWRIRLSSSLVQGSFVSSSPPVCILVSIRKEFFLCTNWFAESARA